MLQELDLTKVLVGAALMYNQPNVLERVSPKLTSGLIPIYINLRIE